MRRLFFGLVYALLAACGNQAASAQELVATCSGCSELQYKLKAIDTANGSSATVYVLDRSKKHVTEWTVFVSSEPGSYYTHAVRVNPADADVSQVVEGVWDFLDTMKTVEVPSDRCPSVVEFIAVAQCQSRSLLWFDQEGGSASEQFMIFTRNLLATAAEVAGINEAQTVTLEFADGSTIKIHVEWAVDVSEGGLSIASWELTGIAAQMNGEPFPMSPDQLGGWTYSGDDEDYANALVRLLNLWGIDTGPAGDGTNELCYVESVSCTVTPGASGQPDQVECDVDVSLC